MAKKKDNEDNKNNKEKKIIKVDGNEVQLTHQDKIYFPDDKITKGDVIEYYDKMYKYILPYLKDRPESLRRQPNGILDEGFYHKNAGDEAPSWVDTILVRSDSEGREVNYVICNNKATLLYLANLGCIEFNPWFSRINHMENPDYLVIDIDPSPGNSFDQVIEAAQAVKEILDKAEAPGYCKTSGASGIHIFIPLGAKYNYDDVKDFAHLIVILTHKLLPETTSLERSLSKRGDRIYLDYLQNRRGQTIATVYSLRAQPGASASTPLEWKELKKGLHYSKFNIKTLPKRVQKKGDIFHPVLEEGVDIKKCLKKLGA